MYKGKHYDGFEYSVNMLLKEVGLCYVPEADFYSYRLTAFSYHSEGKQWFYPILNWADYMNQMIINMGIKDNYILEPFSADLLYQFPIGAKLMLGEVSVPDWDISALQKISQCDNIFLICKKNADGYIISNPIGCISMQCSINQIVKSAIPNRSFIFFLTGNIRIDRISDHELIKRLYLLIKNNSLAEQIKNNPVLPVRKKEKIAFHNGLIRYLQARIRFSDQFLNDPDVRCSFAQVSMNCDAVTLTDIIHAETVFLDVLKKLL